MNKKAKLYSNNNVPFGLRKAKDNQVKFNPKSLLSRSAEKRKKVNSSLEPNLDKSQRVKIAPYKSKKAKILNNNNKNENTFSAKEYANTLKEKEQEEEELISPKNQLNYDILDYTNNEKQNKNEKSKFNKYNANIAKKEKKVQKNNKYDEEESSDEEENKEYDDDDLLYRTLYRTSNKNLEEIREKEEKIKKNNEKKMRNKNNNYNNNENNIDKDKKNNFIYMEQTDNLTYNIEDKQIHLNTYNNKIKIPKKQSKDSNYRRESNKFADKDIYEDYKPKKYEKRNIDIPYNYITQKAINLYIIDDDFDTKAYSKFNKKINRKNNKFREILIEKYEPNMPPKNEKFTGFIFIRKSKGKKMYTLELPDNLEQINTILKNENIMIKNQIIQIVSLNSLNETKKSMNEKNLEKEIDKLKETIKDKERQITILKNKNEDFNNTIKKQAKQITQNEKDMNNIKINHDQLQDSFNALDNENKSLKAQLQAYKIRRKSIQMQIEEESNQRNLQEMKDRIQKYKNDLRRTSSINEDRGNRKSGFDSPSIKKVQEKIISKKDPIKLPENIKKEEQDKEQGKDKDKDKEIDEQKVKNNEEEENYQDDYNYDIYDENDPKAKKMKRAVARFRKKYKDVIIENKKNLKLKEKEEKEKEENERKELEGINLEKEREEKERKEAEEREKKERERKEKERKEREKKEKEEKERKEREERERKEKERKERERKEKERKEKEEKEKKEKEKKEKEKEKKQVIPNKINMGNFSKMLADKMKIAPPGAGMRKTSGGNEYISKLPILEKKVDVVNLIEGQPFKRKNKKKPTRKMFND